MDTEEICSISISPLVTSPFAIQWSPDNHISLITEKGVHVFELIPSPMSSNPFVKFARSFVHPSDILPAHAFINQIDSFVWNLDREAVYSLLMEEAITPKLDGLNETIVRITKVAWSPKNLISPNQCVLAILTVAGAIELLHKVSNEWYSICDVSSLQLKIVQDEIKSKLNECKKLNNEYAVISESMRQLQACSMTWSELFKVKEVFFAYFSVAYRSGEISIWRIPRISNFSESLQPVLVNKINLDKTIKINVLCWITIDAKEHLLIVGCFDGQIYGIKLICNADDLEVAVIERYITPDHISVNYLYVLSQDKSNVRIVAAKGVFLLLLCINSTGVLEDMQHLQVEGYNITGMIPVTAQQFMISTQNSHIFIVDTRLNDLICIDIQTHLPQTHVQYLGLTYSPNKVMIINIASPNTIYDHLVTKEPSTMHIFALKGAVQDPLRIINNSTNLISVWDCIEVLRIKAAKAEDPSVILRQIPEKLDSSSLYDLQLSMWMTVMINVCTTKTQMLNMNHIKEGKIANALPLIHVHSICTYIDNTMKKSKLSVDQMHAVSLLNKYLKMYLADQDEGNENVVHRYARETLNKIASHPNQIEKCNLCDEVIDESLNTKSCSRGHKLPRCTLTLLQITSLEYRECSICNQIFHPCMEEIYEEPQCPFCDVPLLYNSYGFDIEGSELYGKNLSQSRINVIESKDDLEEQTEKQRKDKWNTARTYSVIVNDNEDESARITEKWEKF